MTLTLVTNELPLFLMNEDVLVQISLLGERLVAIVIWTLKGSFTSMHSQMVEEIMPFSEKHMAASSIAFKDLHLSLGLRILIFEDSEVSGVRRLFINLYAIEVEVLAMDYLYIYSLGDLRSDSFIRNRFLTYDLSIRRGTFRILRILDLGEGFFFYQILALEDYLLWIEIFGPGLHM